MNNLNIALQKRDDLLSNKDIAGVVGIDLAIKFNGGGHVNHSIFWTNLAPIAEGGGSVDDKSNICKAINAAFGSMEKFQEIFNTKSASVQGSGWGWLTFCPQTKSIGIVSTANQDMVANLGLIPLLGIDVWEHAYYLKYENRRPEYLKEIWKVVNWANVEERYNTANK